MIIEIAMALAIILIGISVSISIHDLPAAVTQIAAPAVKTVSEGTSNMISYTGIGIAIALVICSLVYLILHNRNKTIEGNK